VAWLWAGYATNEGLKLGARVADYVLGNDPREAG
jgi:hypothetical protein